MERRTLRERPEDILVLAQAFLDEIGRGVGVRGLRGLSKDARDRLLGPPEARHNIRELRNAIEGAVILCEGGLVTGEHLPIAGGGAPRRAAATSPAAVYEGTTAVWSARKYLAEG
ncbi:MAG: hypothetical protein ACRELZ_04025 [Candidatus Rokuibacteriota bacterium]